MDEAKILEGLSSEECLALLGRLLRGEKERGEIPSLEERVARLEEAVFGRGERSQWRPRRVPWAWRGWRPCCYWMGAVVHQRRWPRFLRILSP